MIRKLMPLVVMAVTLTAGSCMLFSRGPTWHSDVSRIVQNNCQTCHRAGGIGPFPFETYDQVYALKDRIAYVIENRIMPPWHADPTIGTWANARSLTDRERATILAWIEEGAPSGDAWRAPPPRRWAEDWNIGEPDAVIRIPEPFTVPAEGELRYQNFYVQTSFDEDKWVQAMELRPTAVPVAHHILAFLESPTAVPRRRAGPGDEIIQGGVEGFFASWVPGSLGNRFPEGTAKRLPKGAWIKFQIHYTPRGEAMADQTMLGFVFADAPPRQEVSTQSAFNEDFRIPAGAPRHEVRASHRFDEAGQLLAFLPHMHYRGAAFQYDLVLPDGRRETLLSVPHYHFHWQTTYELAKPIDVPAGAVIEATAWFDNSGNNPLNPDPTAVVEFGPQSWHEMMIGYFDWVPAAKR